MTNISNMDLGTGYGGTVCGFHTQPGLVAGTIFLPVGTTVSPWLPFSTDGSHGLPLAATGHY